MKIVFVAMRSIHTIRWINQLKDSGFEVHWFDIQNTGYIQDLNWFTQHTKWKLKFGDFKGRTFLKKHVPFAHKMLEHNVEKKFETILNEVKPDVVHSIVLYKCALPIVNVMKHYNHIKWIYSSWGSDLYHFKNETTGLNNIKLLLSKFDYMFADCNRDKYSAKTLGFKGEFLGVFPGGGGFHLEVLNQFVKPFENRDIILIKGYQGRSGRALHILKAIVASLDTFKNYKLIIFGADKEVLNYIENTIQLKTIVYKVYSKSPMLPRKELLKIMGRSILYIGNSASDGMPNTLLEAISMGAFPIQSNPGGATEDVLIHNKNGLLINDVENEKHILSLLKIAINNEKLRTNAFLYNQDIKMKYDYKVVKSKVLSCYQNVQSQL